jgi:hypothetical protein
MAESWIVGYFQVLTEPSSILILTNFITAVVISIGIFLSSAKPIAEYDEDYSNASKNMTGLTWLRGLYYILFSITATSIISISTLDYKVMTTLFLSIISSFILGLFLVRKSFSLLVTCNL